MEDNISKEFLQEYLTEFIYPPRIGEIWEYQIRKDEWINCKVVGEQEYKSEYRYLAEYIGHDGNLKTGLVDIINLREKKQKHLT